MGPDEKTEDLSSNSPLELDIDIECLLGDTDADRVGGEPGGVRRGVLVWDAKRKPCDMPTLEAVTTIIKKKKKKKLKNIILHTIPEIFTIHKTSHVANRISIQ